MMKFSATVTLQYDTPFSSFSHEQWRDGLDWMKQSNLDGAELCISNYENIDPYKIKEELDIRGLGCSTLSTGQARGLEGLSLIGVLPDKVRETQKRFLQHIDMSEQTIKAYSYAVKQFYGLYPQLTDKNLQLYKVFLIERYKPQTVNLRLRAMNCFVRYRESSLCPVSLVHVQQKGFLEQIISQADYKFLKQRLWEDGEYNYYFLIRLMTATGVRISELVLFDVEDVKKGYRDIYSKGNKLRRVYIPAVLRTAFKEWPGFSQRPDGILFLNRFGAPLSASGIRFQLKVFAARYGIDPDVMYPHSFRHRFAKNFIEVCPDIALLSDLLGHDSIETTRIYLRRSSREQYRIVNQVVNW